ncbi:hypothetical protein CPB83DRAFT_839228 [Crepidotus variabilis]|uniref:Uncharacterized protein n=1 Tax=Crepidotus variabilis TaxID=179855 RepID=A0A9P6JKC3_9AGAR|nr:hypothetical protein CPB83DRAFT_839228 [Crepidotus variabilis]
MAANTFNSDHGIRRGEALKNEGNNLHQQGKYRAAYIKYSEAIKEEPKNAVYYANRAASSLALKEQATNLDSKYSKAWGRLGAANAALGSWVQSIEAWKKALACLPVANSDCKENEKRMRLQFLEGLKKAESGQEEVENSAVKRAAEIVDQRVAEGKLSSEFGNGVEVMNLLKKQIAPDGRALSEFSNGLLRDLRAFHISQNDWSDKYNDQAKFEFSFHGGWHDVGTKGVKEQAQKRLMREGWHRTRPGLAITVRAWMMRGFISSFLHESTPAVEFHSRAVDILDWGSRLWYNVLKEDRGVIFEKTFIRGAKRSLINAIHQALMSNHDCSYTRDQLAELSRDLIADAEAHPPSPVAPVDVATFLSFWQYPKADALACLGWYHTRLGLEAEDADSASLEFNQAAKYYTQAGTTLPEDEETAHLYLRAAIEAHWFNNDPPVVYMPLAIKIMDSRSQMLEIWEHSAMSDARDSALSQVIAFALHLTEVLEKGTHSKNSVFKPCDTKELDKFAAANVIYLCSHPGTCSISSKYLFQIYLVTNRLTFESMKYNNSDKVV